MKKSFNKMLLAIFIAIACSLIVAGATILIYDSLSNPTQSSTSDDDWTGTY